MSKDGYVINLSHPKETPEEIAAKLNTLHQAIDLSAIKGAVSREEFEKSKGFVERYINNQKDRIDTNDQRWHGGGISTVIHDGSLTGEGTVASPLAVINGGGTVDSIIASAGISVDSTDPQNPIVSSTITQYTDEMAEDAVAGLVQQSDSVSWFYDDNGNALYANVEVDNATIQVDTGANYIKAKTQMSVTSDASGLKLSGDATTPGSSQYYGTNGSGTKGYFALSTVSGDVVGPASSTNNNVVFFNGVSGKLIKDSGLTLSGSNTGDQNLTPYLTNIAASAAYLTNVSASANYLTNTVASSIYLTNLAASGSYLTNLAASGAYLTNLAASGTYLMNVAASGAYLRNSVASASYLTNLAASGTYLMNTAASGAYLTNVAASASYITATGTTTLSNKRITPRYVTVTQSATPSINTNITDVASIIALAQAVTSFTTNLTGTPTSGDKLIIELTDNGTGRGLTWGSSFESSTGALPSTTVSGAMLAVGLRFNPQTGKWRCVAVA